MNHGTPSDRRIASELAPSELAMPVPICPLRAMMTPVIISGVQPPIARIVSPSTDSWMSKVAPEKNYLSSTDLRSSVSHSISLTNDNQHPKNQISDEPDPKDANQKREDVKPAARVRVWKRQCQHEADRPAVEPPDFDPQRLVGRGQRPQQQLGRFCLARVVDRLQMRGTLCNRRRKLVIEFGKSDSNWGYALAHSILHTTCDSLHSMCTFSVSTLRFFVEIVYTAVLVSFSKSSVAVSSGGLKWNEIRTLDISDCWSMSLIGWVITVWKLSFDVIADFLAVEHHNVVVDNEQKQHGRFPEVNLAIPCKYQQKDNVERKHGAISRQRPPIDLHGLPSVRGEKIPFENVRQSSREMILSSEFTEQRRREDSDVTPSMLNISDPITVPTPISESVTKVLIKFVNSSGVAVAVAMKIAAPTS